MIRQLVEEFLDPKNINKKQKELKEKRTQLITKKFDPIKIFILQVTKVSELGVDIKVVMKEISSLKDIEKIDKKAVLITDVERRLHPQKGDIWLDTGKEKNLNIWKQISLALVERLN